MACFSDPLNLLLLVLLVEFAARPRVFWMLVFVSAWSHELVFFFAPWLVHLRSRNGGRWWREALCLLAVLVLYLALRAPMASNYGVAYYLDKNWWVPWLLPALGALWLLLVAVEFGPLLVVLGWGWATPALGGRWGAWLYFAGILPLMLLAYDVMRFAAFAFLPVVLGAAAMARVRRGRQVLLALVAAAAATYPWLHPVPSQQGGRHFTEIASPVFARIAPYVPPSGPAPAGPSFEVTGWMLAHWWPTFAAVAASWIAAFALGRVRNLV
ncbi:MAG TPA: hypothetical protein ENI87_03180 [bacterium]|nr:hypothetical protein [bacterium]